MNYEPSVMQVDADNNVARSDFKQANNFGQNDEFDNNNTGSSITPNLPPRKALVGASALKKGPAMFMKPNLPTKKKF